MSEVAEQLPVAEAKPPGKDEWYVSRSGQRFGPVTFAEMQQSAKAGRLEPRTDLVIGGNVTEWKPAGEVDGLFERRKPAPEADPASHEAPKGSLADSGSFDFNKEQEQELKLPGATRLGYFLGVTVLPTLLFIGLATIGPKIESAAGPEFGPWALLVAFLIPVLVPIVITVKRFQNLGMSSWWWFGLMVPLLNLWLGYRLFACPPGYVYTKKLGGLGKFLAVIYWISPVAVVALAIVGAGTINQLNEDGRLEEWLNKAEQMLPAVPDKLPEVKTTADEEQEPYPPFP
ncbi:MAG: GYF domain-containing protein [Verrucomicrobiota bacterium]